MGLLLLVVVECVGDWRLSTLKIEGRSYQESCEDSPKREWKEFFLGSLNTECHWDGRNDDYMASPPRVEAKVTKANLAWREWSCWRRPCTFKWILAWVGDHKAKEQTLPLFPTSYKTWLLNDTSVWRETWKLTDVHLSSSPSWLVGPRVCTT